jgi:flagellar protein FlbB
MLGRVVVLLLLIGILAISGIIWFDYLNVIDAKSVLAPVYKYVPFIPGEGRTQPKTATPDELLNLDAERLATRLESLELERMEMNLLQRGIDTKQGEIIQMAQELEEQQKRLVEWENTLKAVVADAENKDRNVEQIARYLSGMPPQNAVNIIAAMDDQQAIDFLRKTEDIAKAEGTASIVSYWFSLMDPARAAVLQRKMAGRPSSL